MAMGHRLLILGSLHEFVQLVDMARARGIYTVVVDGYPNTPSKAHADAAYDIDPGNTEALVALCRDEQIDGIITSFSDYLFECMVKIAAPAGLKCYTTPDKLRFYRNKAEQKELLRQLGIATGRSAIVQRDLTDDEVADLSFPVVVKPLDKYGSRGVFVLHSADEIRACFDEACATSDIKELLVEEYNSGYEFNVMSWISAGQVHIISVADREKTPVDTKSVPISTRNVYPSRLIDSVIDEAHDILQRFAAATCQTEGPLCMQCFWQPGSPMSVCEIAGRFFGYEHELVQYCSARDALRSKERTELAVEDLLLDYVYDPAAIPQLLAGHSPFFTSCCATLYFHGKEGMVIADQTATDELAALPGVIEYLPFYQSGEIVGTQPYVLRYYISCPDRAAADELTRQIFDRAHVLSPDGKDILYQDRIPNYD